MRRIAQFVLDARWPFESEERYRDTLGRLAGYGFDEVTVHWGRPDGHGIPREAVSYLGVVH